MTTPNPPDPPNPLDNDIQNEDLANVIDDPDEYKLWIIEILKGDPSKLALDVRNRLEKNIIDSDTDILLRSLANVMPYNMLIPVLRDHLNLSIKSDVDCTKSLRSFKKFLKNDEDKDMINNIIAYINSDSGELSDDIIPEIDLLGLIEDLPIEKFQEIYNCIEYINKISE